MFPQVNTSYNHKLLLTKIHKTQIEKNKKQITIKRLKLRKTQLRKLNLGNWVIVKRAKRTNLWANRRRSSA